MSQEVHNRAGSSRPPISSKVNYFEALPDEILLKIFQSTTIADRLNTQEAYPKLKGLLQDKSFTHFDTHALTDEQVEGIACANFKTTHYSCQKHQKESINWDKELLEFDSQWIVMTDENHSLMRLIDRTTKDIIDIPCDSMFNRFKLHDGILTLIEQNGNVKQYNLNANDFTGTVVGKVKKGKIQDIQIDRDSLTIIYKVTGYKKFTQTEVINYSIKNDIVKKTGKVICKPNQEVIMSGNVIALVNQKSGEGTLLNIHDLHAEGEVFSLLPLELEADKANVTFVNMRFIGDKFCYTMYHKKDQYKGDFYLNYFDFKNHSITNMKLYNNKYDFEVKGNFTGNTDYIYHSYMGTYDCKKQKIFGYRARDNYNYRYQELQDISSKGTNIRISDNRVQVSESKPIKKSHPLLRAIGRTLTRALTIFTFVPDPAIPERSYLGSRNKHYAKQLYQHHKKNRRNKKTKI